MKSIATESSLQLQFAHFLDNWRAKWTYEARWPTEETTWGGDSPEFRVWLPMLHAARWKLGKAFYLLNPKS